MKVHLKQIPTEGLHLEGEEDCPISEADAQEARCIGPLRYNIDVGISDGALWANGSLKQMVEVACVSCLEKFLHEINVPAFAVHTELHGPEVVDLTPMIREDILLNLPAYPHCDRDGGRVCKAAFRPETRAEEETAERKREADWQALDQLKLKR